MGWSAGIWWRDCSDLTKKCIDKTEEKNGKEIFEGDIVKVDSNMLKMTGIVTYNDNEAMFVLEDLSDKIEECLLYMQEDLEVIGNIYDNLKLLRGE